MESVQRKRMLFGGLLAWTPMLFILLVFISTISRQRTSGLGAVAGGLSEALSMFGLVAAVASQIGAVVLLFPALRRAPLVESFIAALSICCAGFTLVLYGLMVRSIFAGTFH